MVVRGWGSVGLSLTGHTSHAHGHARGSLSRGVFSGKRGTEERVRLVIIEYTAYGNTTTTCTSTGEAFSLYLYGLK